MNPEAQRIAIAKACGWKLVTDNPEYNPEYEPYWEDLKGNMVAVSNGVHRLPDYLNDLNAMHEAEDTMYDGQLWIEYEIELTTAMDHVGWQFHATAAQRAEAFLKALNLWKP